jgi:beta-lactamase superfamily II metal-dependent hydrolase
MSETGGSLPRPEKSARQLWPIFICYRQVDGLPAARRLHELLDKETVTGPSGEQIELDVYLDQTMPAVADWRELHRPYLERARAILVVCSPGAKIDEGPDDWVQREIDWWLEHRTVTPILIDPLRQGLRYVPSSISARWPESQRIPLVESEWIHLAEAELREKAQALRRQIVGAILPSGAAIYTQELEAERKRAEELKKALDEAVLSRRLSQATLYDAQAAAAFEAARRHEMRWEASRQRQLELRRVLDALPADESRTVELRRQNLRYEIRQLDEQMRRLTAGAAVPRREGYARLELADDAWGALEKDGHLQAVRSRTAANPPYVFSVELINAGSGESILVHYGPAGATRLVMINAGPRATFADTVRKRLQTLKAQRFAGAPVPIELFVASDQDEHKTGGLLAMLEEHLEAAGDVDRAVVELRGIWVNVFAAFGFRGRLRSLMATSGVPINEPFDHLVMRPERGQLTHALPGGLEVVVLGPTRDHLRALYEMTRRDERRYASGPERTPSAVRGEAFPDERFSRMKISESGDLLPQMPPVETDEGCVPSRNAKKHADVALVDKSTANLASTILLFRYRNKTFLHTGDSRADFIMEALVAARQMEHDGRAHVSLLHLPHLGSSRNLSREFLERVTADEYLFSGDGTHGNPEIKTIASLIAARPCQEFVMNFVNRDGRAIDHAGALLRPGRTADDKRIATHGDKLDAFFAAEEEYSPRYRRLFRATDHGSVIIDLLDRVTY